jgi:inhibitor of KinA sporulation pathway (predicted exonuclease)
MTLQTQRFIPDRKAIVFDLETGDYVLSSGSGKPTPIWNIGATLINSVGEIQDTFESYVRIEDLTLLTPDIRFYCNLLDSEVELIKTAPTFPEVYSKFIKFCGYSRIMSWSGFDSFVLEANVLNYKLPNVIRRPYMDCISFIAGVLADSEIVIKSYSLKNLCEFFGIEISPNHRGLQDSICASKVLHEVLKLTR